MDFKINADADNTFISQKPYQSLAQQIKLESVTTNWYNEKDKLQCLENFISQSIQWGKFINLIIPRCWVQMWTICWVSLGSHKEEINLDGYFEDIGMLKCEPVKIGLKLSLHLARYLAIASKSGRRNN